MEENKEKQNVKTDSTENQETKLTYEQLNQVAIQLHNQLQEATKRINEMNLVNAFERLKYLFKVVEYKDNFNGAFVINVIKEIENMMTIPDQEEDKKESETKE
jgi:hypothetical protein